MTILGKGNLVDVSRQGHDVGSYMRSGRRYDSVDAKAKPAKEKATAAEQKKERKARPKSPVNEPINEEKAKKFLNFLKYNEYSVVEQLQKQLACISVLVLLLSSEVHRSALMKVLN